MLTRFSPVWALFAAAVFSTPASAQAWPAKPVKVVVAFTAGGTTDILARAVGQQLQEKLKQPFIIENKPGAGGNTGTEGVVRSAPDGYTLIVNSVGPIAVNPTLYGKLPYNPLTDLVPIVQIADVPNVLVVHPSVPAKTFDEFLVYAKANPGKLNCSSTGIGTSSHLSCFLLSKRASFEAVHVPYKGADALRDLMAGRVQFIVCHHPFGQAAHRRRHVAGHRGHQRQTQPLHARRAHRGRAGFSGFRSRFVVWLLCPQGHAGRGGGHAEQGGEPDHRRAGLRGAVDQGGLRPGWRHT